MTRKTLDMDSFLENLTDQVRREEKLVERDSEGRIGNYQDIGCFLPFICEKIPKTGRIWLPSLDLWEKDSINAMEQQKQLETENQEPEEFANGGKKAMTISR